MAYRYFNIMIDGQLMGEHVVPRIGLLTDYEDDLADLQEGVNTDFLGVVDTGVVAVNPAARTMYIVGFPDDSSATLQEKINLRLGITTP